MLACLPSSHQESIFCCNTSAGAFRPAFCCTTGNSGLLVFQACFLSLDFVGLPQLLPCNLRPIACGPQPYRLRNFCCAATHFRRLPQRQLRIARKSSSQMQESCRAYALLLAVACNIPGTRACRGPTVLSMPSRIADKPFATSLWVAQCTKVQAQPRPLSLAVFLLWHAWQRHCPPSTSYRLRPSWHLSVPCTTGDMWSAWAWPLSLHTCPQARHCHASRVSTASRHAVCRLSV